MSFISNLSGLLRAPVGNNLENRPKDVENTKRNFAREGCYGRPVENGYIDQDLDDAIHQFQRNHKLKVDGVMNPGGETEAMLISKRLKLPDIEPKNAAGVQHVNDSTAVQPGSIKAAGSGAILGGGVAAGGGMNLPKENRHSDDPDKNVPLFGAMAKGLGVSGAEAA